MNQPPSGPNYNPVPNNQPDNYPQGTGDAPQGGYPPGGYQQPTPQGGYSPEQPGGYPPPQQQGGYPPPQGGYPPPQGGYPPPPQGGYPPPQPGYQQPGGYQPPTGGFPPPTGATTGGRPSRLKWVLGCAGLAVVGCILFFAFTFFAANSILQPLTNTADGFMNALKAGNYSSAFSMCHPDLQKEVGDADGLKAALSTKQPTTWSWSTKNMTNGLGHYEGSASFADGTSGTATLEMRQVGSDWKVTYVDLK